MATTQIISKADEARNFLAAFCRTLDKEDFRLRSVYFQRDEQTGELKGVRLSYEVKEGGEA